MNALVGKMVGEVYTASQLETNGLAFGLGDIYSTHDGKQFIFCQASAPITGAGYVCGIDEANVATMLSASAGGDRGDRVGVAPAAMAANEYGWFQVYGAADVQVAVAVANALLAATSTAGQLDDAVGKTVERLTLTAARTGSAGLAAAMLVHPTVGATTA